MICIKRETLFYTIGFYVIIRPDVNLLDIRVFFCGYFVKKNLVNNTVFLPWIHCMPLPDQIIHKQFPFLTDESKPKKVSLW